MNTEILGYNDSRTNIRKRIQILQAARELFLDVCVDQTTMYYIAELAGVTRRTVYNYYDSKEQIAVDLQILAMEEMKLPKLWTNVLKKPVEERLMSLAYDMLVTYIEQMTYITCFDFYFSEGYPDSRYVEYLSNVMKQCNTLLGIGDTGIENHEEYSRIHFIIQMLGAYLQRIIQQNRGIVNFPEYENEIRLFIRLLLT